MTIHARSAKLNPGCPRRSYTHVLLFHLQGLTKSYFLGVFPTKKVFLSVFFIKKKKKGSFGIDNWSFLLEIKLI